MPSAVPGFPRTDPDCPGAVTQCTTVSSELCRSLNCFHGFFRQTGTSSIGCTSSFLLRRISGRRKAPGRCPTSLSPPPTPASSCSQTRVPSPRGAWPPCGFLVTKSHGRRSPGGSSLGLKIPRPRLLGPLTSGTVAGHFVLFRLKLPLGFLCYFNLGFWGFFHECVSCLIKKTCTLIYIYII